MQDRIKELAVEAGIDPHDMCEDPRIALNNLARFAQAIARECIDALKTVKGESSECSDGERRYFEADTSDYVDAIRARFGIAEE